MMQSVKEPQVHLPGSLPLGLLAHNPMIPISGVVVLFTASTTARLVFHAVADCSVICVLTDDKFPWLGCCTCDFKLSHWMSWAMHSCPALRGETNWEHMPPIQKEAKWLQHRLLHFCGERCRSGYRAFANCLEEESKSAGNTPAVN